MNKVASYLLIGLLALSLSLLGKVGCDRIELQSANEQLNKELMQANLEKGRAETQFGDANKYIKELEDQMQEEIKQRKGVVKQYSKLRARYNLARNKLKAKGKVQLKDLPENPAENNAKIGSVWVYLGNDQFRQLEWVMGEHEDSRISAIWKGWPNNSNWDWELGYKLHLLFGAKFAEVHTPSGAVNHYASIYEVDEDGNEIQRLELTDFQVIVDKPDAKQLFWWAPHLDVGALGLMKLTPPSFMTGGSLGVSIAGYGRTVNDLDYRLLRISMDLAAGTGGIGVSPVVYNLGTLIPLISNMWVGPHLHYGLKQDWGLGLFLGAVL